jgi:hypothetical protein
MSIISSYDVDSSAALTKRFAALATTYVDDPTVAKSDTAKVPLENLFRILEMFRYDAFADEGAGYEVEFTSLAGNTLAVVTVPASAIRGS